MSNFSYPHEFYDSCENQYNPYNFTSNSYGYFNDNYCSNDSNFASQTFQHNEQPSTLENSIQTIESLLEISTQQDQMLTNLCNSYLLNNSSQGFQNNRNFNSLQTSSDFNYNPCQINFELQNSSSNSKRRSKSIFK